MADQFRRPVYRLPRRRFLSAAACTAAAAGAGVPRASAAAREGEGESGEGEGAGRSARSPETFTWTASWVAPAATPPHDQGVYLFRRRFELASVPTRFVVHVSGDNRYRLFCNGEQVGWGPARGDLANWRYETVDLAARLRAGKNLLAAVVWNFGELAPLAQISHRTAFLVQGDGPGERMVDTGAAGWRAARDPGHQAIRVSHELAMGYYVAGPGERLDAARHPWGWEKEPFDDRSWPAAEDIGRALSKPAFDSQSRWFLVPRELPAMEERPQRLAAVRRSEGIPRPPAAFPAAPAPFQIPARTRARVLLDQGQLTTGYPELTVSGVRGARVRLTYLEALRRPGSEDKGHRNEIEGKEARAGCHDEAIADGGRARLWTPLWWRSWRYLELSVETGAEPVVIEDLRSRFVAYPFEGRARFAAPEQPELDRILEVGWRTARLCAQETYLDCPYYEQLQYAGDTRIQALVSLFTSGDDRLVRNAIFQIDDSRTGADPTASRYPSRLPQYVPPFSLWWIGMVHDHFWYRDDAAVVKRVLPGVRAVLAFFARHLLPSGLLGPMPWWCFVDWAEGWPEGTPPGWTRVSREKQPSAEVFSPADPDACSAPLDLQHLLALEWGAALERAHGSRALGEEHRRMSHALRATIRRRYWDPGKRLFADTAHRRHFSQHTNALAVLAQVARGEAAAAVMTRVLEDPALVQASIYFRYYVNRAATEAGLGDRYLDLLGPWRQMLALGLTTWAEQAEPARSDCHGWGASPNIELYRTVLGIDAAAPGFRRALIRPHLGPLRRASGRIPHPRGEIVVELARAGQGLEAVVNLPPHTPGELRWGRARRPLRPGRNTLSIGRG